MHKLNIFLLFTLSFTTANAQAPVNSLDEVDLARIREQQDALSESTGVAITYRDFENRSTSTMAGVPLELRSMVIHEPEDLISLLPRIYPYYGFTGTESLRYEQTITSVVNGYVFREYIRDIATPFLLSIWVDADSNLIQKLNGNLVLDRDYGVLPVQSPAEAVNLVLEAIRKRELSWDQEYRMNGNHRVEVVYRLLRDTQTLAPIWKVSVERNTESAATNRYQEYFVNPDGNVPPYATYEP